MRKNIVILTALGLILAGCNNTTPNQVVTTTTTVVTDVVNATKTACAFVPTATTIAQILNASSQVMSVAQIAELICKAVTQNSTNVVKSTRSVVFAPILIEINGKVIQIDGTYAR